MSASSSAVSFCHPDFGVAHRGGIVAVNRTEISLPVNERVTQRKFLRHTDNRVVSRRVAVRVIFTDRVADDAGALFIRFVVRVAEFVHRPEDAPVDGFQPVAHVGQSASDDDAIA